MDYGKLITVQSYQEGVLVSTKVQHEVPIHTSKDKLLGDILEALRPLTSDQTSKVEIEICKDQLGRYKLIKRWKV